MGRTVTPKYRVEYSDNLLAFGKTAGDIKGADGQRCNCQAWNGRATKERLEDWRKTMNASFKMNGANWHVSEAFNMVVHVHKARIVRQADGKVMARVYAPAFEVA